MKALLCVLGSLLLRELYADDWLTVGRAFQPLDCSKPRPRGVQCDEETNACYAGAFSALVSPGTSQLLREKNALRPRYVELISALERETTNSKFAPDRALATSLRSLFLEADTPSELRTAGSAVVASLEAQLARKDATGRLRVARLACDVAPLLPRSWSGEAAFWSQNRPREDDRDRPRTPEEDLALRARMAPAGYTPAPALLLRAFDEEVAALQREKRILSSPVIDAVKEAVLDCRPLLFPGVHPGVGRQDTAPVVWAMNAWERILTEWCDTPGLGVGGVKIGIDTGDEPRSAGGAGLAGGRFGSVLSAFDRSSSVSWASLRGAWNYITGGGGGGSDVDVGEQYHSVPGPYNRLAALADGFHGEYGCCCICIVRAYKIWLKVLSLMMHMHAHAGTQVPYHGPCSNESRCRERMHTCASAPRPIRIPLSPVYPRCANRAGHEQARAVPHQHAREQHQKQVPNRPPACGEPVPLERDRPRLTHSVPGGLQAGGGGVSRQAACDREGVHALQAVERRAHHLPAAVVPHQRQQQQR